ncbi:alkane 1-monooxygenase [Caldimonas brevitalea]|nr:alkane 1-monooxygenase [Caldimonas brevitalea]
MSETRQAALPAPLLKAARSRWGHLLFVLPGMLPVVAWALARQVGAWDLWAWFTPFVYFVIIPVLDFVLGEDRHNHDPADESELARDPYYRCLPLSCLPLQLGLLFWGAAVWAEAPFGLAGQLGWIVSMGCVGGVQGINAGHELIHKSNGVERAAGGVLLASVLYGSFKVEHIYGHHVDVATPDDNSTARRGESVYAFIARALARNVGRAFALERRHTERRGEVYRWARSEVFGWMLVSAAMCAVCVAIVGGTAGFVYYLGQAFFAIVLLETINYVEHYGLQRQRLPDGRYERVNPMHSWNSDYLLTNLLLFHLQRHSDHHAHATRRYHLLRHFDQSPQLPFGYATMVVLSWVPSLWRSVMHPRLDRFQAALSASR